MKNRIYIEKHAGNLPESWDRQCTSYFQCRGFLVHTEEYNPCKQRYYYLMMDEDVLAGAIVYSLRLDVFTFLRIKSPLTMNIVGVPCSVSCPGIFGIKTEIEQLKNHILANERGFLLFLNLEEIVDKSLPTGTTLPTLILKNRFTSWNNYLNSLRSDYRRRAIQLQTLPEGVKIEKWPINQFTREMHQQYLNVFQRSHDKLEKLSFEFFQNLNEPFSLMVCTRNNEVIGWNITLNHKKTFYFFLGGIDYRYNKTNSTYLRLMLQIAKEGIECGATNIDLGQTAEIPKMRLGAELETRYMQAFHSNKTILFLLKKAERILSYNRKVPQVTLFKTDTP